MPKLTERALEAAMQNHHMAWWGSWWVYRITTARCRMCMDKAKSRTSLDRMTKTTIATDLDVGDNGDQSQRESERKSV